MELFFRLPSKPIERTLYFALVLLVGVMSWPWIILPRRWMLRREKVKLWSLRLFQEDMFTPQEKVCCVEAFPEEEKIHDSLYTLVAIVSEFESHLEAEKNILKKHLLLSLI